MAKTHYRWIVLAAYSLLSVAIEIQWLTFAPIAREARAVYGASAFDIDLLALLFLILFIVFCLPASYAIDKYGIRKAIGFGAVLTGVFGLAKGLFASSYGMMVVCQIGLGIAQPFILNAVTKVAVNWFPLDERATAVGIATLAQFVGFVIVNMAAPHLVVISGDSYDLGRGLMTWGIFAAATAALFLVLMREHAEGLPDADQPLTGGAMQYMLRERDMVIIVIIFFNGLGIFNAIATSIDQISEQKSLTSEQTGAIMATMFVAAIVGAVIMPAMSDRIRRRKPFLVVAMALTALGLVAMTVADSYAMMLASAGVIGFFLLGGAGPIGFQYAAEVSHPVPESLSQGVVLLAGQISGIVFVVGMNVAGVTPLMYFFTVLAMANVLLATRLRESRMILTAALAP